jgi:hypothetical protein
METTNPQADTTNPNNNKEITVNTETNVPATTKPKNGRAPKPKASQTPPAPPPVEVPPGFVAGKVQRVEPSGTSTVPAGDYTIYTTTNAAGKQVRRILVEGTAVVVKRLGDRLVACKAIEKTGKHVGVSAKRRGEAGVEIDLSGLKAALAAFQLAGGNAQEEVECLAVGYSVQAAKLEAQRETLAAFQAQIAAQIERAVAEGGDINAIIGRISASAAQAAVAEPTETEA